MNANVQKVFSMMGVKPYETFYIGPERYRVTALLRIEKMGVLRNGGIYWADAEDIDLYDLVSGAVKITTKESEEQS